MYLCHDNSMKRGSRTFHQERGGKSPELRIKKLSDDTKDAVRKVFKELGMKEGVDYTDNPDEYRIEIKNEKGEWKKTIRITKLESIPVDGDRTPIEQVIKMIVLKEKMLG